jgi:hypothetical protein
MGPIGCPETSVRMDAQYSRRPQSASGKKCCMHFLFTMQNGCLAHFKLPNLKNLKILGQDYKKDA